MGETSANSGPRPKVLAGPADTGCMKIRDDNHIGDTVRIKRPPPKVFTDELGRNVWMSGIEPCRLELEGIKASEDDPYNSGLPFAISVW